MLRKTDLLKAIGTALAIMVVNVAISFPVVAVYAYLVEPGHEAEFYEQAAQQWIAPWSSVVAGILLFFGVLYWLTRRAPQRPAIPFAIAVATTYVVVDLLVLLAAGALASLGAVTALSLTSKLVAAVAGATLAKRR